MYCEITNCDYEITNCDYVVLLVFSVRVPHSQFTKTNFSDINTNIVMDVMFCFSPSGLPARASLFRPELCDVFQWRLQSPGTIKYNYSLYKL